MRARGLRLGLVGFACAIARPGPSLGQTQPRFSLELEAGPVWQSRNEVQIPNDEQGTRFSLEQLTGQGPWASGRLYFSWNISNRHGIRALIAPLSFTETGVLDEPVRFAGETYLADEPTEATYEFNSWRLTYRYRLGSGPKWKWWVGITAKVRDAKIELAQRDVTSKDTDLGLVPLLYLAGDWNFADNWHAVADFDGLAGGPGRAFDLSLKLINDVSDKWSVSGGYRTLEGGVDTDDVYNFAWFNYAVVSGIYRF
ncbi:MAG: hypothetical protein P8Y44_05795 [Acidobacteriota bacterium]